MTTSKMTNPKKDTAQKKAATNPKSPSTIGASANAKAGGKEGRPNERQKESPGGATINAKKGKTSKAEAKPKRVSALDAAVRVLQKAGKPMRCQEMITIMAKQGLWSSPAGKTPHATLSAAIQREINMKGKESRFKKVDRGQFEFHGSAK